jgi:hypothetical protein
MSKARIVNLLSWSLFIISMMFMDLSTSMWEYWALLASFMLCDISSWKDGLRVGKEIYKPSK